MAFIKHTQSKSSFLTPGPAEFPQATQEVLPVFASEHPVFDLLYHPRRWGWMGGQWLPILRRLARVPGSQNVDIFADPSGALAIEGKSGWVLIPHASDPKEDYVVSLPARGGRAHFFRWEKVKLLGGQLSTSCDEKGYVEWLARVCEERGLAPDIDLLQWKIEALEKEIDIDEAGAPTDLKAANRAKKMRAQLEAMKKALEEDPEPVEEPVQEPVSVKRKS